MKRLSGLFQHRKALGGPLLEQDLMLKPLIGFQSAVEIEYNTV